MDLQFGVLRWRRVAGVEFGHDDLRVGNRVRLGASRHQLHARRTARELELLLRAHRLRDSLALPLDAVDAEPWDGALGIKRWAFRALGPWAALLGLGIEAGWRMFPALRLEIDQRPPVEGHRRASRAAATRGAIEVGQGTVVGIRTGSGTV